MQGLLNKDIWDVQTHHVLCAQQANVDQNTIQFVHRRMGNRDVERTADLRTLHLCLAQHFELTASVGRIDVVEGFGLPEGDYLTLRPLTPYIGSNPMENERRR